MNKRMYRYTNVELLDIIKNGTEEDQVNKARVEFDLRNLTLEERIRIESEYITFKELKEKRKADPRKSCGSPPRDPCQARQTAARQRSSSPPRPEPGSPRQRPGLAGAASQVSACHASPVDGRANAPRPPDHLAKNTPAGGLLPSPPPRRQPARRGNLSCNAPAPGQHCGFRSGGRSGSDIRTNRRSAPPARAGPGPTPRIRPRHAGPQARPKTKDM